MQSPDANPTADQSGRHPASPHGPATVRHSPADELSQTCPLLVTADPRLLDEVLDLARRRADLDVASDPLTVRDRWVSAPLVLVGVDLAESCVRARLPRRPGVIVVGAPREGEYDPPWATAERLGAEHIAMLPAGAPRLTDRLSTSVRTKSHGVLVAVLGGRGGAGATVLACGLAVTAVRLGLGTFVIDGDPLGGGLDLVFGFEGSPGLRWPDLTHTPGAINVPALASALPQLGELAVLSCGRDDGPTVAAEAMVAALTAARDGWDLTVVDLQRRFDDATVAALAAVDHTLLVVPAELRACAAAARVAAEALRHTASMSLVVRTPGPGRLPAREISRAIGLPLAGTVRSEPSIARGLERGEPPASTGQGPLATLCTRLLPRLRRQ